MLDPEAVEAKLPSSGSRNTWFVLGTCALSPAVVEQCFADDEVHPLARNRHTPADALARLARHPDAEIRRLVATRPDLGPEAAELRQDPDENVRGGGPFQGAQHLTAQHQTTSSTHVAPITEPSDPGRASHETQRTAQHH
ncbi:hypothetical protein [Streptomyces mirabilis]